MTGIDFDYIYKIILVGNSGVGKSNILNRLIGNSFDKDNYSTIGIDFQTKTFTIRGDPVKLQIWDTAGQEKYRSLIRSYYKLAAGIILVFDITKRETFNQMDYWMKEVENNVDPDKIDKIEILIIGNKTDLKDRQVFPEDIQELNKKYKFEYIETSAQKNKNIEQAFKELTARVHGKGLHIHCSKENFNEYQSPDYQNNNPGCCNVL